MRRIPARRSARCRPNFILRCIIARSLARSRPSGALHRFAISSKSGIGLKDGEPSKRIFGFLVQAKGATGSPSPRTTNSGRVIASRCCKRLKTNASVGARPITADNDVHVIQADTSSAAYAVGVVKRVVGAPFIQHAVTVAGGIEIGTYNVSVVVDFMDGCPNRPFPGRVKLREGLALVGGSERVVIPAGVGTVHGDHIGVVDSPGGIQTYGPRRVYVRERPTLQQVSMLFAGRVDVGADHRAVVINSNGI